ncbi:phosphoribosylaminoimidazolecarboxamide formyltransferase / IMP cyclohydrolase [Catalinimonas alkaloidigena]|uniref:Bifunctional purine biosynthesis protein PurH n=1 Tax=Catalinimonas alkaloidigena TaxID=1075417 RepID=A0A1G9MZL9_9BACT|nr:bifunctional phosphoribosylaminoimidazolecarboxamide formyltransferase/IMP cyclohydrolase [Catalinimonas alkaloidigena]SDL79669.1 phosphoribosylaminoimidazolecarboxamide formyltransferase / IMP cyclohydrolase [Catalinimonas alkaloidigena]
MSRKKITSALISVYNKERLDTIVPLLHQLGVRLYSTGGTQTFIQSLAVPVTAVEEVTGYPSILGGRVKTLHPKVFGGILNRREHDTDQQEVAKMEIPNLDLVVVDLYPFEDTVASAASEADIIEKIDIGGISLIRAAAKNFKDVLVISSRAQYEALEQLLREKEGYTDLEDRKRFATKAFDVTSHYDVAIHRYFLESSEEEAPQPFKQSIGQGRTLRYGENPHQKGIFYGDLEKMLEQLHGKELSYNNLVDIDAAVMLMQEFEATKTEQCTFAILKHTNACGLANAATPKEAYLNALAGDPVSAFGGVIITNQTIDAAVAEELDKLFFEVLIAPDFAPEALETLKRKKNRILLKQKPVDLSAPQFKTLLNGVILQDKDLFAEQASDLRCVTERQPTDEEVRALLFAVKAVKHAKSNTIVLARENQLIASGVGQTSRVDALKQAIEKARHFGFSLEGAVMASDAFFPFPDCVEIAHEAGIRAVVQPGGSIRDQDSIDFCNAHGMGMVLTGVRHFKH